MKGLYSKIRKTSNFEGEKKEKIHTYSHKMSVGTKRGALWDTMKIVSHLGALARENLLIFAWNGLRYWNMDG